LTLGDLRKELPGVREHQLKYAIASYRIEPVRRAGIIRLWHRDQLPLIRSALSRIAGRREVAGA
jgi:hypothetical protein